tara:strand:- start:713 stop:1321 length:609 start_codon:yes stop_codon:yes gene_type:complete
MRAITFDIMVRDKKRTISFKNMVRVLKASGDSVVSEGQNNLSIQDKVVTGNLQSSLYYEISRTDIGVRLSFKGGVPYWDFVEQGVKGAVSDAKAPDSEYKFGTGSGERGSLKPAIRQWISDKGLRNTSWRSNKGRFLSYDQMASVISRSVYLTGLRPSNYFTMALDNGISKIKRNLKRAITKDVEVFFTKEYGKTYKMIIEF